MIKKLRSGEIIILIIETYKNDVVPNVSHRNKIVSYMSMVKFINGTSLDVTIEESNRVDTKLFTTITFHVYIFVSGCK